MRRVLRQLGHAVGALLVVVAGVIVQGFVYDPVPAERRWMLAAAIGLLAGGLSWTFVSLMGAVAILRDGEADRVVAAAMASSYAQIKHVRTCGYPQVDAWVSCEKVACAANRRRLGVRLGGGSR